MTSMAVALSPTRCFFSPDLHSHHALTIHLNFHFHKTPILYQTPFPKPIKLRTVSCYYSESTATTPSFTTSDSEEEQEQDDDEEEEREARPFSPTMSSIGGVAPPVLKKRKRYRKEYPGERKGIAEELRFVAMKLRNDKGSKSPPSDQGKSNSGDGSWEPSMEGFLKYLVDSKLVFETLERIVEDSSDVYYAYFRKTGLERAESLAMDLEWFDQRGILIPKPSNPGVSYATYLKELGETSVPLFLCHFYIVYFSHIAGGQVIARQVAAKLVEGRELEFYRWERDAEELLKEVRLKLNRLGEHWSRDDKNKCLREAAKSFKHLGQIVRLIIL
uniref:Heme oxygenase (Biliverdin-producing) n=2 Tax=Opuntia streptacantha TaxID=393608 RepID=A0A7C9EEK9_OPUST